MTKVVHFTTVHPRLDTRILRKQCVSLREAGKEVHLVVADGLGQSDFKGVTIHDVGSVKGRVKRMLILPLRAFSKVRSLKPDVVQFHDPELLAVGLLLKWMGHTVVYDSHEDLPRAIMSKHWIRPTIRTLVSKVSEAIEDFCASRLSAVVTATPHIGKRFAKIQKNTISVTNYPVVPTVDTTADRNPEPRTFVYIGAISEKRSAREMIEAVDRAGGKLILAGPFEDIALETSLRALPAWRAVEYMGVVDHTRVWELMNRSLAGLLFFYPEPNHINSVPNKMFEYMAGGIPILCSDFEDWRQIIAANRIGLACDPTNTDAIAALMRQIIENPEEARAMGDRGRATVMAQFRWENEAAKLVALYERLLGGRRN